MATKSILKNISIKNNASARNLVRALEHAGEKKEKPVDMGHAVSEASRDEIRLIFANSNKREHYAWNKDSQP